MSPLEAGDVAGSAVRRRVLKAVKEIQREEPGEGESVNEAAPILGDQLAQ